MKERNIKIFTFFFLITYIILLIIFGEDYNDVNKMTTTETTTAAITTTETTTEETTTSGPVYLGKFVINGYCSCAKCCGKWASNRPTDADGEEIVLTASGNGAIACRTVAVDPSVIPLGTVIYIDGHAYVAEDTGSAVKGNVIDIYYSSHEYALEAGRQIKDVYMKAG